MFTHGELARIATKLRKFAPYCKSLLEEVQGGIFVPPLTSSDLTEARQDVEQTVSMLMQQIQECAQMKIMQGDHLEHLGLEELQWHLLRFETISLSARAAKFKVTRNDAQSQSALRTTVVRPHDLGTKWTKDGVQSLVANLDVVRV